MSSPDRLTVIERKRLYVGCGLTLAPQGFVEEVEDLKKELRAEWNVLEFLGVTAGTSADVYQRDIVDNVGSCDAFLAISDYPSIGLGYELAIANEKHLKPILATAKNGTKITRLLLGATEIHENMVFQTYEDMAKDVPQLARQVFAPVLGRSAVTEATT